MPKPDTPQTDDMRLDKWLWCARFYKTRGLAAEAIKGGKITLNGERAKPSKTVEPGSRLTIRRGPYTYDIEILTLAKARKSAAEAILLYRESAESIEQRETLAAQLKLAAMHTPGTDGRPTKRDRRTLIRFKTKL